MPRRYKQGTDGQPHPAFYGKLPEEFSKTDTMRFMVETDLKLSGCVSADTYDVRQCIQIVGTSIEIDGVQKSILGRI